MMTRRPHQSSDRVSPKATWQGCAYRIVRPLEGKNSQIGLQDRAAILFANPEVDP
ncbi:hypothetical protein [Pendulispora albinea]|uniref:Uncharacterized protein n=1 Tax=Pendulispora albinea TaxID=2741071 RepID=A0ABZ2M749_9BACT